MKETFTIEEIRAFLKKAFKLTEIEINPEESMISNELDKAWNRGAQSMFNRSLVQMYTEAGVNEE